MQDFPGISLQGELNCNNNFKRSLSTSNRYSLPHLWHLVDVKELRKTEAQHVCGQVQHSPPSLTGLLESLLASSTQDTPQRTLQTPGRAPFPGLPPHTLSPAPTMTLSSPPPHRKHCRDTQTDTMKIWPICSEKKAGLLLKTHLISLEYVLLLQDPDFALGTWNTVLKMSWNVLTLL